MQLKGLPEGVELVEVSDGPRRDVFYLSGDGVHDNRFIRGGAGFTVGAGSIIIEPSFGYRFQYDIQTDSYTPIKLFVAPVPVIAEFRITNSVDLENVRVWARHIPGFVSISGGPE